MALIGFHKTGLTKDVWHIVYDGAKGSAYTLLSFLNRSSNSVTLAVATGSSVQQGDTAVDGNGDLVLTDIDSVMVEDIVSAGEQIYFDTTSGKILLPQGQKLVLALSGNGDLNTSIVGAEA